MSTIKKAWEYGRELVMESTPFLERTGIVSWDEVIRDGQRDLWNMKYLWGGNVTESLLPIFSLAFHIQEYGNIGYDISAAEAMIPEGLELARNKNDIALYRHTIKVYNTLFSSPKDPHHEYWKYPEYSAFDQYSKTVDFPEYSGFSIDESELYDRIYAGWMAQVCAGAVGTAIEGFHTLQLEKTFGWIDTYLKDPEMYNDDLTFELTFLETFIRKGYRLKAIDIAEDWAARLPFAFTAEGVALRNIKMGMLPPECAKFRNTMFELIGAQMRGGICGMIAPANPKLAAALAWEDASVSHYNNGILGEVFNAVMVSMAYAENDMRSICRKAIDLMPKDSKYYSVVDYAWKACEKFGSWREAWLDCDEKYKQYHWIHAYPNAAAEVVALYFCDNSYDYLVGLIAMCGLDIDCNAAQVANILATAQGSKCIDKKWLEPMGEVMATYVRGMDTIRYKALAEKTTRAVLSARK